MFFTDYKFIRRDVGANTVSDDIINSVFIYSYRRPEFRTSHIKNIQPPTLQINEIQQQQDQQIFDFESFRQVHRLQTQFQPQCLPKTLSELIPLQLL